MSPEVLPGPRDDTADPPSQRDGLENSTDPAML